VNANVTSGDVSSTTATGTGIIIDDDEQPTVGTITSDTVKEGETLKHTVTMSNPSASVETYDLNITDVTTSADDYEAPTFTNGVTYDATTGKITVPANVISFDVLVKTIDDGIYEESESYTITVGGKPATGTIIDETQPSFTVSDARVEEGNTLVFDINLSNPSSKNTYIIYKTVDGTAVALDDYASKSDWIKINAGTTGVKVSVTTVDDDIEEDAEENMTVVARVVSGNVSNDTATGTGIILDNEDPVEVASITDDKALEGTELRHFVEMTGMASSEKTYPFTLTDGTTSSDDHGTPTFTNGVTYDAVNKTITVPAKTISFSIAIFATEDTMYEGEETYTIDVGTKTAVGTIVDLNTEPSIGSIGSDSVLEGTDLNHSVTIVGISVTEETYDFNIVDETTEANDYGTPTFDNNVTYDSNANTITVPAGTTSFNVIVPTKVDTISEVSESYELTIGNNINSKTATGTIRDDNKPTVTISNPTVTEGGTLVFDINLSMASATDIFVTLKTVDGTDATTGAKSPDDYTHNADNIFFAAGSTGGTLEVETIDDDYSEETETMTVDVLIYGITENNTTTGTGTILDNEDPVEVASITDVNVTEGQKLTHTVTMTGISSLEERYEFTINDAGDDTATKGMDYSEDMNFTNGVSYDSGDGTLTVPANTTTFDIIVASIVDTEYEVSEFYTITVKNKTAKGTINDGGTPAVLHNDRAYQFYGLTATVNILDNDDTEVNKDTLSFIIPDDANGTTDANGNVISVTVKDVGVWTMHVDGQVTFKPMRDYTGSPTLNYTAKDNNGYTLDAATITMVYTDS